MKMLKMTIRSLAFVSVIVMAVTQEAVFAIPMLAFSSASIGILIGEKQDGGRKHEAKR